MPRHGPNRPRMLIAAELAGALVLMVVASDAFTNAVEWIGSIFQLSRGAVGSVVAAIGSSLPETMIAFVALVVLRDPVSRDVGIGAVIGAPFMLATAVFCLIGLTAIVRRQKGGAALSASMPSMMFGLMLFALTFAVVIVASFAPTRPVRIVASVAVLLSYGIYLAYHLRQRRRKRADRPQPLRFAPRATAPAVVLVIVQLLVSLAVTIVASRWFVSSVAQASAAVKLSPLLVSVVLSPIASELPEALNVTIWMRRNMDELAVGNVVGAMMFQTSIASVLGMLASPWRLTHDAYLAAAATFAAIAIVVPATGVRRQIPAPALALCGLLYAGFLVVALAR